MEVYRGYWGDTKERMVSSTCGGWSKGGWEQKDYLERWYFSSEWWADICQEPEDVALGRGSKGKHSRQWTRRCWVGKHSQVCCVMVKSSLWLDPALKWQGKGAHPEKKLEERWAGASRWVPWIMTEFEFYSFSYAIGRCLSRSTV